MWETKLDFIRSGLYSLIQDMGREGLQSYGVPRGGAMDTRSMIIANRLVGNNDINPVIEIALSGPKIKTSGDAYMAITGAEIEVRVNKKPVQLYETLHIPSGSIIDLGFISEGARSYLAINGKWKIGKWLRSTGVIPALKIESLLPNRIKKNSSLTINTQKLISKKIFDKNLIPRFKNENSIRVLLGPEYNMISNPIQEYFLNTAFTVHKNSNRMAVSVVENIPNYKNQKELISSANLIGSIQLTNQGQLLILMNDAGTTGGYPRIANVISTDLSKIAQLIPGQKINFELVDIDFAVKEIKREKDLLLSIPQRN